MKRSRQQSISFILTAIYLLLTLSPLAPIAIRSNSPLHVIRIECSGDCRTCGCSAERSASHTCCCWQKRLSAAKAPQASAAKAARACCSRNAHCDDHDNDAPALTQQENSPARETLTVIINICPCGSGKDLACAAEESTEHIPCRYSAGIPVQRAIQFAFLQPERLASRNCEPPDPPPKIYMLS